MNLKVIIVRQSINHFFQSLKIKSKNILNWLKVKDAKYQINKNKIFFILFICNFINYKLASSLIEYL